MNRPSRVATQLLLLCVLSSLIHRFSHRTASVRVFRQLYPDLCRITWVKQLAQTSCDYRKSPRSLKEPCRWDIRVRSSRRPHPHALSLADNTTFTASEVLLLRQLDGCESSSTCKNETVTCVYGIEDPSDAFWLRDYETNSKFVVIFRVGFASLLFFLVAIFCDGSIFYPHRPGAFSISSASILAIIAFASLLYLLIVPQHLQLSIYGGGIWQSVGYVFIILMIAGTLPGIAVAWVSVCLFLIYFLGFFVEQLLCMLAGILHYFGALSLYQAENTLFHLRLIYYRDVEDEAELDQRLLDMSHRFLRRVRGNFFMYRVPSALEQDGLQVVQNTIPDHLFDELFHESIPEMDFENLDESHNDLHAASSQSTIRTPLLQRSLTT